ncbi:MAG: AAA family ATPase [Erysipelotrichaceae bacterium]|nr:AAA family ATPase [Erysipelotrichaceae bacterium]
MIKVMLISKNAEVTQRLRNFINDEELGVVATASQSSAALDWIENTNPDLLVVYMNGQDFDSMQLMERVVQFRPRTFPILIQDDLTVENMQAANNVGVHNIITMPKNDKEFCQYLQVVYKQEKGHIDALGEKQTIKWSSKIVTVFGAKDRLGKTTLAVNLAVYLASKRKKVALLDLDLQFGDVCMYMDLEPKETVAELMQDQKATNIETVQTYMAVHSSGVHVLSSPKSPEYAEIVGADRIQNILAMLRTYYDFVIIDAPTMLNDVALTALESANRILLVSTYDMAVLKNSKLAMNLMESLSLKDKIRVVLSMGTETKIIRMEDIGRVLEAPITCNIPSDAATASSSLNKGQPFVTALPRNKMSLAIAELGEILSVENDMVDLLQMNNKERKSYIKKNKVKETKTAKRPKSQRPLFAK